MRATVKRAAERSLCRIGMPHVGRTLRRGDTLVLAYHNIVPAGEPVAGEASLHLPEHEFARQLELIARTHTVVPITALLEPATRTGRPRAVITFDDAYQGAVTAGARRLAALGLPATFFVAPAFVGGRSFWWDALAAAGRLNAAVRSHALGELQGKDASIRRRAHEQGTPGAELPWHATAATEAQLAAAAATPGITLASHSWSHANLACLPRHELEEELARPLAWLRRRYATVVPWLSYPYGAYTTEVEAAAMRLGYAGAFRIDGGWLPPRARRRLSALPRLNVPAGVSLRGFELRISGVLAR